MILPQALSAQETVHKAAAKKLKKNQRNHSSKDYLVYKIEYYPTSSKWDSILKSIFYLIS